jgi:AAA domain/DnaB-like helicase N terminal domain
MDFRQGLPASPDTERFVLGSILLDDVQFPSGGLPVDLFSLERHRRIWRRMSDIHARGERIDRVTLCNELKRTGELEADTVSYVVALDDGLPQLPKIDSYIRILKDKAARRRIIFACENLKSRAQLASEDLVDVVAAGGELFASIDAQQGTAYQSVEDIPSIAACGVGDIEYVREPELPRGAVVAITGDAGCGKSTLLVAWARDAWRSKGVPSLILDRENPASVIVDRLARLGMEDGPGVRIWGGWLPEEAPQPDSKMILDWVRAHEPKPLIIVDSYSGFNPGDQNDAGETRVFMTRCRRVADLGATVALIHHDGKAETARDYRGSSDFKAAVDQAYHVTSFGTDGRLDKLMLRPYKSRIGAAVEITYSYSDGQFIRCDAGEARQTVGEQLTGLLRLNPGVTATVFENLANDRRLGRNRARTFLGDGIASKAVRYESVNGGKRYFLAGQEAQSEI